MGSEVIALLHIGSFSPPCFEHSVFVLAQPLIITKHP
jgi:hypothetical protein